MHPSRTNTQANTAPAPTVARELDAIEEYGLATATVLDDGFVVWDWCTEDCPEDCLADHQGEQ